MRFFISYKFCLFFLLLQIFGICQVNKTKKSSKESEYTSTHWIENGLPYIQNFSPKDYNAEIQNFSIAQNQRGLMYFANNKGVLVFDGASWRLIQTANNTLARSICFVNNKLYVGCEGDIGYLKPDSNGELKYVSLLNLIPKKYRDFHDVYQIISKNDTIYFHTRNYLFRLYNDSVKVWNSKIQFDNIFIYNNNFYIALRNNGIWQMKNDSLQLSVKTSLDIRNLCPYDETRFMICTFSDGLFFCDGKEIKRFPTEADSFLTKNKIYQGINLPNDLFAFATGKGAALIDKAGNLCQIVNKTSGLRDEFVINLLADKQGGLWLALDNGIARIELPSPISRYQDALGMDSFSESIVRYNGKIYSTAKRGVYYLDNNEFPYPKFKPVSNIATSSFSLITAAGKLLDGTQDAIYEIQNTSATKISDFYTQGLYVSSVDTNRVYIALLEGFAGLEYIGKQWIEIPPVPGISLRIIAITENPDGSLWFGTEYKGLFKANIKMKYLTKTSPQMDLDITHYGEENGLPTGKEIACFNWR